MSKTTIYDFAWTEEQGLWATNDQREPTVLIEASVRERDDESDDEYGEPVANYLVADNIEYQSGDGVVNDEGRIIFGEAARKFIEDRAKLATTCISANLGA